ncbi:MAG TPA: Fic family protein [Thermoanaerobaculia bacterium]|jgi:Fic family protein|nr:Fic family protein [Thermoanaerobaculia bacterium]
MADSPVGLWQPRYALTPSMARRLMEIEAARTVVEQVPLPPAIQSEMRNRARLRATHYSTRIEGNRLTLAEAEQVLAGSKVSLHGRERDVGEVRCYWKALLRVEEWAARGAELTEELIQRLHALVEGRARPSRYRDGQNTIRDSETGALVYLPPEAKDVPALMAGLVAWIRQAGEERLPPPLIAGLAHYQFVTIHPYYDGNGRTARLLATFLLQRDDYGLNGLFSLEEEHARDLSAYYNSLAVHPHHNYYEGRDTADLTSWLEYFLAVLATAFTSTREEILRVTRAGSPGEPEALRRLDARARAVLALFARQNRITAPEVARLLGLADRTARLLLQKWTEAGWLVVADPSRRGRVYELSASYRQLIGNLTVEDDPE